jgi:arsenite methyltransferase
VTTEVNPSLDFDNAQLAEQYERLSLERQFRSGQLLVKELDLKPGERVLDIGAGTGLLAQYAADIVGPTGEVIGIDPLPHRIEIAKSKARPCAFRSAMHSTSANSRKIISTQFT